MRAMGPQAYNGESAKRKLAVLKGTIRVVPLLLSEINLYCAEHLRMVGVTIKPYRPFII